MSDTLHVAEITVFEKSPAQGYCVQCHALIRNLKKAGVEFDTEFLDSPEGLSVTERAKAQGKQSAPLTRVLYSDGSETLIAGNNLPAVKEALGA